MIFKEFYNLVKRLELNKIKDLFYIGESKFEFLHPIVVLIEL